MFNVSSVLGIALLTFMSLLPTVNPLGTALIIDPYLQSLSRLHRAHASFKIALYSFLFCTFSAILGASIFRFFGISIPVVQIAGGFLISRMGYEVLHADGVNGTSDDDIINDPEKRWNSLQTNLFYPLTFPMTTGAGTISIILTLSADSFDPISVQHFSNQVGIIIGSFLMSSLVFVSYNYSSVILKRLGQRGQTILNRLSGFLTLCVGIQVLINGILGVIERN